VYTNAFFNQCKPVRSIIWRLICIQGEAFIPVHCQLLGDNRWFSREAEWPAAVAWATPWFWAKRWPRNPGSRPHPRPQSKIGDGREISLPLSAKAASSRWTQTMCTSLLLLPIWGCTPWSRPGRQTPMTAFTKQHRYEPILPLKYQVLGAWYVDFVLFNCFNLVTNTYHALHWF